MRDYLLVANGIGNDTDFISEISIGTALFQRHFAELGEEDECRSVSTSEIEKAIFLAQDILHSIEETNMQYI